MSTDIAAGCVSHVYYMPHPRSGSPRQWVSTGQLHITLRSLHVHEDQVDQVDHVEELHAGVVQVPPIALPDEAVSPC